MKKVALIAIALLFISGAAMANGPLGYIGLFADGAHTYWCATGAGFYPVEMWIWCLPGMNGMICAEFAVGYPVNVIQSTVTWNVPLISVSLGDIPSGLSVCFVACQYNWLWIAHQTCWVTSPEMTNMYIKAHPEAGVYQFANCLPGYPVEPCIIYTNMYINRAAPDPLCEGTATEDASWGAIKSMME
jgi:hypothetical protein